jgi:hypothetical protein
MKIVTVDATEAWVEANRIVNGLRFRTFEDRLRKQCTEEGVLPPGVFLFEGTTADYESGHVYIQVEVEHDG